MAAITISGDFDRPSGASTTSSATAGEGILKYDFVYRDTDGKVYKLDNTSVAKATFYGIALEAAKTDYGLEVLTSCSQPIELSSALLTVGEVYFPSDVGGKLQPTGDNVAADICSPIAWAPEDDKLMLTPGITPRTLA